MLTRRIYELFIDMKIQQQTEQQKQNLRPQTAKLVIEFDNCLNLSLTTVWNNHGTPDDWLDPLSQSNDLLQNLIYSISKLNEYIRILDQSLKSEAEYCQSTPDMSFFLGYHKSRKLNCIHTFFLTYYTYT